MATPVTLGAAISESPREDFWVPDGAVHAILITNEVVYLGGAFNSLSRPNSPSAVAFDQSSGSPDPAFPFINCSVYAIVSDGAGGWFVGGQFTEVGGLPRTNLVHLLPDKRVDPDWQADADAAVLALVVIDHVLYVGGSFTSLDGQPRRYLGAIDVATGQVTSWDAQIPESTLKPQPYGVRSLTEARGLLYVGGGFQQIGGKNRENLAAINPATGSVTDWYPISFDFSESGQVIDTVAVLGDTVYVGGSLIFSINTTPRGFAAAFDATSSTNNLLPWNPNANGQVYSIVASCDAIYLGGEFTSIGGQPRSYLAAVDPVTGAAHSWNPNPDGLVRSLQLAGNTIYVGGRFDRIGGQARRHLAGIDVASALASTWDPQPGFGVSAMSVAGNNVFAGGIPVGIRRRFLAALNARTGQPIDWEPNPTAHVYSLALWQSSLLVGGDFAEIGGQLRNRLAAVTTNSGVATSWNPNVTGVERTNAVVESIVVSGNTVYVSGSFTNIAGQARYHLAAINAATGQLLPWQPSANDDVRALRLSGNTLYAGGRFTDLSGQNRRRIAALDATTGVVLPWNPQANDAVRHIAFLENTMLAGGLFSTVAGTGRQHIAALDGNTGLPTAWMPQAVNTNRIGDIPRTSYVNVIQPWGDAVFVGGWFNQIGSQPRANFAAMDAATGAVRPWNANTDLPVIALATDGRSLFAGGLFTTIGAQCQPNFAVFPPFGSPRVVQHPQGHRVSIADSASFSVQAEGLPPLSYQWQLNGTNIPGANSTNFTIGSAGRADVGEYTVVVTNALGLINSRPAELVVIEPLGIVTQPQSQIVAPGTTVTLSVVAEGRPRPVYQWRRNGINIPGAIYPTLTISNAQPTDGGSYEVVVAGLTDALTSDIATVLVTSPALPFSDNLATTGTISGPTGLGSGNNVGATNEPGEPIHANVRGGRSVWLQWVAPANGIATFNTLGSSFDTLLAIYALNSQPSTLNPAASDDDQGGFYTSRAQFRAISGMTYLITVDGFFASEGNIVLSWNLQPADPSFPLITRQPVSLTVATNNEAAFSVTIDPPNVSYQWFRACDPIPGATSATLIISNVQPQDVGNYRVVVQSLSGSAESESAALEIGPETTVLTRDKIEDEDFTVAASRESAALMFPASAITPGVLSVSVGTIDAQLFNNTQSGGTLRETNHCGVLGGASRYLDFTALTNGVIVMDTIGSAIDTVLAVYFRTNLFYLSRSYVTCDNNSAPDGIRSLVRFPAVRGRTYRAFVDGVNAAKGDIRMNWKMGLPPAPRIIPSANVMAHGGKPLELNADTSGLFPPNRFQWRRNGVALPGRTNAVFSEARVDAGHAGAYSVIAFNDFGAVTNDIAVITVAQPVTLRPELLPNRMLRLRASSNGMSFLWASTNLSNWTRIHTNTSPANPLDYLDRVTNSPRRFYRLQP